MGAGDWNDRVANRLVAELDDAFVGIQTVFLLDYPNHSNVGDSAIYIGEMRYFARRRIDVVSVTSLDGCPWQLLDTASSDTTALVLHGGGNFGDLYPKHQAFREQVIRRYPNHRIVGMPQSVAFSNEQAIDKVRGRFSDHRDLKLFGRDRGSVDRLDSLCARARLAPDSAHLLNPDSWRAEPRRPVSFLFRGDIEAVLRVSDADWPQLRSRMWSYGRKMMDRQPVGRGLARAQVTLATRLASRRIKAGVAAVTDGELLVTDRLHAMLLALLAGRPVVAIDNSYGKLSSYATTWLDGADVTFVDSLEDAADVVYQRMGRVGFTAHTRRFLPVPTATRRAKPDLVSVVIPAHNAASDIEGQLTALARQNYAGSFEVVVADNMSTDGTRSQALDLARTLGLRLRVVDAMSRPGVSHARNAGCAAAHGELIAMCDADDIVVEGWLSALAEVAENFDMVGGSLDSGVVNEAAVRHWRKLPPPDTLPTRYDYLPYAHGCNIAVWRDIWRELGGWDESITKGGEDIEFAWRLQVLGHTLGVAPEAVVHYRLRDTIFGHARQMYGYQRNAGLLMRAFRSYGLRRNSVKVLVLNLYYIARLAPPAVWSRQSRAVLAGHVASLWGRIQSSVEYRVWAL